MIKEPSSLKETNSLRDALETLYPGVDVNCGHPATGWIQRITFPVGNAGTVVVVRPAFTSWGAYAVEHTGREKTLLFHEKATFGAALYYALSCVLSLAAEAEAKALDDGASSS